jgi:type IV secretion system protein VirB1
MQISSRNFQWLGLTVETAFNACDSLRAAAQHLTSASAYNTGSPTRGFANGYVQKIVSATFNVQGAHPLDQAGGTVAGASTSSTDTAIRLQREASSGATVEKASPAQSSPPVPSWDLLGRARSGAQSVLALNAR